MVGVQSGVWSVGGRVRHPGRVRSVPGAGAEGAVRADAVGSLEERVCVRARDRGKRGQVRWAEPSMSRDETQEVGGGGAVPVAMWSKVTWNRRCSLTPVSRKYDAMAMRAAGTKSPWAQAERS